MKTNRKESLKFLTLLQKLSTRFPSKKEVTKSNKKKWYKFHAKKKTQLAHGSLFRIWFKIASEKKILAKDWFENPKELEIPKIQMQIKLSLKMLPRTAILHQIISGNKKIHPFLENVLKYQKLNANLGIGKFSGKMV